MGVGVPVGDGEFGLLAMDEGRGVDAFVVMSRAPPRDSELKSSLKIDPELLPVRPARILLTSEGSLPENSFMPICWNEKAS